MKHETSNKPSEVEIRTCCRRQRGTKSITSVGKLMTSVLLPDTHRQGGRASHRSIIYIFDQSDDQSQGTFIYLFIFEPHKTRLGSYILKSINLVHLFG